MGDTTIREIDKQTEYFTNNLGVFLKFLKKIIETINNMITPCHLIHQSNPIAKNERYE
jgi:hypothetical protein